MGGAIHGHPITVYSGRYFAMTSIIMAMFGLIITCIPIVAQSPIIQYSPQKSAPESFHYVYLKHIKTTQLLTTLQAVCPTCDWSVNHAMQSVGLRTHDAQWAVYRQAIQLVDKPVSQVRLAIDIIEVTNTESDRYQQLFSHLTDPIIQGDTIKTMLQMMVSAGQATIVSSPTLTGSSGTAITLMVGEKIPYVRTVETNGYRNHQLEYLNSGITIDITPYVHYAGTIHMDIDLTYNTVNGYRSDMGMDLPIVANRQSTVSLYCKAGESIVFAGFIDKANHNTIEKVPFLGDIPLLGLLFQRKLTTSHSTDVIYRITPHQLPH
jgi:type II secretory pathway component GspD/PulD (secretin)